MTRSATEQPDVAMDVLATRRCRVSGLLQSHPTWTPFWEIHIESNNDMWWVMPHEHSDAMLQQWTSGAQQVAYAWEWRSTRQGSCQPNGEHTSISRYSIDFDTMDHRDLDNGRTQKAKVVCVDSLETHGLLLMAGKSMVREIHVEFNHGKWWAMPQVLSDAILQQWSNGAQEVSFVWDWHSTRQGSYQPNGEHTSVNRYIIDFDTMDQRNIDNGRTRKVKVVFVAA